MSGGAVTPLLGALAVALLVASVLLGVSALSPAPTTTTRPAGRLSARQQRVLKQLTMSPSEGTTAARAGRRRTMLRVTGFVAGLVTLLVTRWPVAAVLAHLAVVYLPRVLGGTQESAAAMERLQGLADWTRRLSTLLVVGSGLEEALVASRRTAPAPVSAEVGLLVTRLQARRDPTAALQAFADDIDDPVGDQVAAALILAMARRGRGLAEVLVRLSETVSEQVATRRQVEADRATPRATARNVTTVMLLLVSGIVLFDRDYLRAYDHPSGQLVLLAVGGIYAGAFAWMRSLSATRPPARFLSADAAPAVLKQSLERARVQADARPGPVPAPVPPPAWNLAAGTRPAPATPAVPQ